MYLTSINEFGLDKGKQLSNMGLMIKKNYVDKSLHSDVEIFTKVTNDISVKHFWAQVKFLRIEAKTVKCGQKCCDL